jgi:hypothetical protein
LFETLKRKGNFGKTDTDGKIIFKLILDGRIIWFLVLKKMTITVKQNCSIHHKVVILCSLVDQLQRVGIWPDVVW